MLSSSETGTKTVSTGAPAGGGVHSTSNGIQWAFVIDFLRRPTVTGLQAYSRSQLAYGSPTPLRNPASASLPRFREASAGRLRAFFAAAVVPSQSFASMLFRVYADDDALKRTSYKLPACYLSRPIHLPRSTPGNSYAGRANDAAHPHT